MGVKITCKKCENLNELPEGKTFMFCAHCGKRIELDSPTKEEPIQWPIVLKSENQREVPFKEMKSVERKRKATNQAKRMMGDSDFIIGYEHQRTEGGYNIRPTHNELIGSEFYTSKGNWEFMPFEYEVVSDHNAVLNLSGLGVTDLIELQRHYIDKELASIAHLDLSDNELTNLHFETLDKLKNLKRLNLKNNKFKAFPLLWKDFDAVLASDLKNTLESINLSDNFIELNSGDNYPFYSQWDILVRNNPFLSNLPKTIFLGFGPNPVEHELSVNLNGKITVIPTENGKVQQAANQKMFEDRRAEWDRESAKRQKAYLAQKNGVPNCFIATAATGSYNHPDVVELRRFRDDWIQHRPWGDWFINNYYHYGSIAARFIEKCRILRMLSLILIVKPVLHLSRLLRNR